MQILNHISHSVPKKIFKCFIIYGHGGRHVISAVPINLGYRVSLSLTFDLFIQMSTLISDAFVWKTP